MIHQPPTRLPLGRVALWEHRPASLPASLPVCRPSPITALAHGPPGTPEPQPRRAPARVALNPARRRGRPPDLQGIRTRIPRQAASERNPTLPVTPATSQNGPPPKCVRLGSFWNGPSSSRYSSTPHHRWNPGRAPAGFSPLALLAGPSLVLRSKPCTGAQRPYYL